MPCGGNGLHDNQRRLRMLGLSILVMLDVSQARAAEQENKYSDADAQAIEILNGSLKTVGPEYRGQREALNDPIAKYVLLLGRGLNDQAAALESQVCVQWRAMPPNLPFTGNFSIGPFPVSLDKMCGIEKKNVDP